MRGWPLNPTLEDCVSMMTTLHKDGKAYMEHVFLFLYNVLFKVLGVLFSKLIGVKTDELLFTYNSSKRRKTKKPLTLGEGLTIGHNARILDGPSSQCL